MILVIIFIRGILENCLDKKEKQMTSNFLAKSNTRISIDRIGYVTSLVAFISTMMFCIIQLWQVYGTLTYPFDEILIYGFSLCIVIPFLLSILAFHYNTSDHKKFWSHGALIFSIMYAVFVTANYVVQLATVIPMTLNGKADEIKLLVQTPHSLFWDFDALGYVFMGLTSLFLIPALETRGFEKWVRYACFANVFVTPMIAVVYFYPVYSEKLLMLGYPWGITAPLTMLMLALNFRIDRMRVSRLLIEQSEIKIK
jgi:hypothetical protein